MYVSSIYFMCKKIKHHQNTFFLNITILSLQVNRLGHRLLYCVSNELT